MLSLSTPCHSSTPKLRGLLCFVLWTIPLKKYLWQAPSPPAAKVITSRRKTLSGVWRVGSTSIIAIFSSRLSLGMIGGEGGGGGEPGFHDVCWRYGVERTGEPRCQEPGTWPHQKNIYILECVCLTSDRRVTVSIYMDVNTCACIYAPWTRWLLRTMKSNWHSLPLCGVKLFLWFRPTRFLEAASCLRRSRLSQVGMSEPGLWLCFMPRRKLPLMLIYWNALSFLMVGGKTLSVFGGSYTISCHRKKNASWSPETWSDNLFDLETTI